MIPRPDAVKYAGWEIFLMRLGFAALLWDCLPDAPPPAMQPFPNGLAHLFNLTFLANPAVFEPLRWVFLGMLLVYVSGRAMAFALPYLLFLNVACQTLSNSQGWIDHPNQIVSLVLLAQTVFHVARAVRKGLGKPLQSGTGRTAGDLEVFFTLQTIAATYLVAGLTKLLSTHGAWFAQLPNIAVQIVKTNDQFYYDRLIHPYPGFSEWLNGLLVAHPGLAYPIFGPGLLVELGTVFILCGRKAATVIGVVLLGMHALIHIVMQITFTTNIALVVIYLLNVPFLVVIAFRWLRRKFQRPVKS